MKRQTLDNLLDANYQNILETAYSNSVTGSKNNSLEFSSAITNGTPITTPFADERLSERLNMVAKTIAARDILNVSNQTFFVQLGGFDTHDNIIADTPWLWAVLLQDKKSTVNIPNFISATHWILEMAESFRPHLVTNILQN